MRKIIAFNVDTPPRITMRTLVFPLSSRYRNRNSPVKTSLSRSTFMPSEWSMDTAHEGSPFFSIKGVVWTSRSNEQNLRDARSHWARSWTLTKRKMMKIGEILDIPEWRSIALVLSSFSDIENIDWTIVKATLASSDAWSICRLGDYLVRAKHRTWQLQRESDAQAMQIVTPLISSGESMTINDEADGSSSTESFDMLDDIYASQLLFRLMPQTPQNSLDVVQPIIEAGQWWWIGEKTSPSVFLTDLRRRRRSNPSAT